MRLVVRQAWIAGAQLRDLIRLAVRSNETVTGIPHQSHPMSNNTSVANFTGDSVTAVDTRRFIPVGDRSDGR